MIRLFPKFFLCTPLWICYFVQPLYSNCGYEAAEIVVVFYTLCTRCTFSTLCTTVKIDVSLFPILPKLDVRAPHCGGWRPHSLFTMFWSLDPLSRHLSTDDKFFPMLSIKYNSSMEILFRVYSLRFLHALSFHNCFPKKNWEINSSAISL